MPDFPVFFELKTWQGWLLESTLSWLLIIEYAPTIPLPMVADSQCNNMIQLTLWLGPNNLALNFASRNFV